MLNAPSTATELDRGVDMRRNVPMTPLLAPQPRLRKKKNSAAGGQRTQKKILASFT